MTATAEITKGAPRSSGYDRADNDWYVEQTWGVEALFDHELFIGALWDPCCGMRTIPDVAMARGFECAATDLTDRGYPLCRTGINFLAETAATAPDADSIVFNPPYDQAEEFIRHALTLSRHKVAALVRLSFLEGIGRKEFFETTALSRVHVFSRRLCCPPGMTDDLDRPMIEDFTGAQLRDEKGRPVFHKRKRTREEVDSQKGGFTAYAWLVWEKGWRGPWHGGFL